MPFGEQHKPQEATLSSKGAPAAQQECGHTRSYTSNALHPHTDRTNTHEYTPCAQKHKCSRPCRPAHLWRGARGGEKGRHDVVRRQRERDEGGRLHSDTHKSQRARVRECTSPCVRGRTRHIDTRGAHSYMHVTASGNAHRHARAHTCSSACRQRVARTLSAPASSVDARTPAAPSPPAAGGGGRLARTCMWSRDT